VHPGDSPVPLGPDDRGARRDVHGMPDMPGLRSRLADLRLSVDLCRALRIHDLGDLKRSTHDARLLASMARLPALVSAVFLGAAGLTAGCAHCLSTRDREAVDADLVDRNRVRAEPAMRAEAEQHGATLLPAVARDMLAPLCGTPEAHLEWSCLEPSTREGVYRLQHVPQFGVKTTTLVVVATRQPSLAPYVRLARASHSLLLLIPDITPHKMRSAEACGCDAGETSDPLRFSFVLDDLDVTDVEQVHVPMVEDFVDWQCRVFAL
jgi:hypothetical protein